MNALDRLLRIAANGLLARGRIHQHALVLEKNRVFSRVRQLDLFGGPGADAQGPTGGADARQLKGDQIRTVQGGQPAEGSRIVKLRGLPYHRFWKFETGNPLRKKITEKLTRGHSFRVNNSGEPVLFNREVRGF